MCSLPTFIGLSSAAKDYVVDAAWVQTFAGAIPEFVERASDRSSMPLTFACALVPMPIPGLNLPESGLIHGEQRFRYHAPLEIGETISVVSQVTGYRERGGTAFITITTHGRRSDSTVVFQTESLILAPTPALGPKKEADHDD